MGPPFFRGFGGIAIIPEDAPFGFPGKKPGNARKRLRDIKPQPAGFGRPDDLDEEFEGCLNDPGLCIRFFHDQEDEKGKPHHIGTRNITENHPKNAKFRVDTRATVVIPISNTSQDRIPI
jgi:hypothetical protein